VLKEGYGSPAGIGLNGMQVSSTSLALLTCCLGRYSSRSRLSSSRLISKISFRVVDPLESGLSKKKQVRQSTRHLPSKFGVHGDGGTAGMSVGSRDPHQRGLAWWVGRSEVSCGPTPGRDSSRSFLASLHHYTASKRDLFLKGISLPVRPWV
jgi:hypothetical protein